MYINRIDLFCFLCNYINVWQKKTLDLNIHNNDCHQTNSMHTFLDKQKAKKLGNIFKCQNPDTLQKARQFLLRLTYKNHDILCFAIFHNFFKLAGLYENHDALSYVIFYIQKVCHFTNNKAICVTFIFTKIRTLCVIIFFIEVLKLV